MLGKKALLRDVSACERGSAGEEVCRQGPGSKRVSADTTKLGEWYWREIVARAVETTLATGEPFRSPPEVRCPGTGGHDKNVGEFAGIDQALERLLPVANGRDLVDKKPVDLSPWIERGDKLSSPFSSSTLSPARNSRPIP
jgi:hypothetical protein